MTVQCHSPLLLYFGYFVVRVANLKRSSVKASGVSSPASKAKSGLSGSEKRKKLPWRIPQYGQVFAQYLP